MTPPPTSLLPPDSTTAMPAVGMPSTPRPTDLLPPDSTSMMPKVEFPMTPLPADLLPPDSTTAMPAVEIPMTSKFQGKLTMWSTKEALIGSQCEYANAPVNSLTDPVLPSY